MSDNKTNFEKLSFLQLLKNAIIEIPIIQRDYAQGREGQKKVRNDFLEALYAALTGKPEEHIELDFVYGSKKGRIFQPLDGQQRLTTLFLLHWYIAFKEDKTDEFKKKMENYDDKKKEIIGIKFSYNTRISSHEFCNELTASGVKFKDLLTSEKDREVNKNNELSKTIKNSPWFVSSWEKDPTIAAMLIMLDDINLKFKNENKLWDRLIDEKEPPIIFRNIILENFGLSDDLYIKMNARGKPLTEFENFKSQFEKYIEEKKFEKNITITEETFAHKIDTVWMDLFWQYRKTRDDDNNGADKEKQKENISSIDDKIMNFIAGAAINYYAENPEIIKNDEIKENIKKEITDINKNITDDTENELIGRKIGQFADNPNGITPKNFPTIEAFQYLINYFNKYSKNRGGRYTYAELKPDFDLKNYFNNSLFEEFINFSGVRDSEDTKKNLNRRYKPRVLFFAQTVYLFKNDIVNEYYSDWMRVVRNIVENSYVEDPNSFISTIRLVKELSNGCMDIYTHLAKNEISASYAKEQVKEEIEKAKIITANKKNKEIIHRTEDANFCKGRIYFALYCIDYDIDKTPDVSNFDPDELNKICNVFNKYLSGIDVDNDFRRAFFTIGDNDFYKYWDSWLHIKSAPKYTIIESIIDLKKYFTLKGKKEINYFKELILKLSEKDIDTIINDYKSAPGFNNLKNWKQRIIKEKGLLNDCKQHYVAIPQDDSCCWLIPGQKVANNKKGEEKLILIV